VPVRAKDLPTPQLTAVGRAIRASEAEVRRNPRARSAVLRVAEKN
jgi:16S rRNA (cytosine1402-N4)-methyltransferase